MLTITHDQCRNGPIGTIFRLCGHSNWVDEYIRKKMESDGGLHYGT
jgi:hypothetical protein